MPPWLHRNAGGHEISVRVQGDILACRQSRNPGDTWCTVGCIDHGDFAATLDGPETTGRPRCDGDWPVIQEDGLAWNMAEFQTRVSADHGHNWRNPGNPKRVERVKINKSQSQRTKARVLAVIREHGAGRHGSPGFRIRMTPRPMVPAFDSDRAAGGLGKAVGNWPLPLAKAANGNCVTGMDRDWRLAANGRPPCCAVCFPAGIANVQSGGDT